MPGTAGQKEAARVEVSGYIVNEENKAVPYAAIVFRDLDTGESSGTMADGEEGFFSLEILPGTYMVEVSSTGYFTSTKEIEILEKTRLPPFVLKEKAEVLDEVVVRHEIQRKIKHNATGMVVSPQNDSLFKKISTTDILELLPGVSISENGNISLNGVPAMVTIDGKPRRLTGDLLKTFLESISGDQLKTIELINNPSARYSGHVKKVIDITLKRERDDGISGTVSTRVNNANLGVSPGIGLDYKRGKFTFSFFSMPYSIFRRKRETYTFRHDSEQ
ncbi:TonB-dependent receptor [Sinomicrobium soli]|uniref:TonB-dependent receptor n=1 Tax=Sinomicrobium sp. N-1-3-6 TaxID=2219864 RepID=UPI001374EE5F|nr:carboxypeptidase-like regulatory domain-containing protein [Sinomicrobium sp. N-1-3-6]